MKSPRKLQGSGYRVQVTGFRLQGSGYRVQVTGFRGRQVFFLATCHLPPATDLKNRRYGKYGKEDKSVDGR